MNVNRSNPLYRLGLTAWAVAIFLILSGDAMLCQARESRWLGPQDPDRKTIDQVIANKQPHPHLFFRKSNIPGLRERMNEEPCASMAKSILKTADAMLDDPIDQEPEPGCAPMMRPEGVLDTVYLDVTYDFYGFGYHMFDYGTNLGLAWVLTGDPKYARRCRDWLLAFAAWERTGMLAAMADNTASHAIQGMTLGYDWIYDYLNPNERQTILHAITREARRFSLQYKSMAEESIEGRKGHLGNNHTWVSNTGLAIASLGVLYEVPEAADWLEMELVIFRDKLIPATFGLEGEYVDGAGAWMRYTLENGQLFFSALHGLGGPNLFANPRMSNTVNFYARANGYFAPDWKGPDLSFRNIFLCLAKTNRDPVAQYLALAGGLEKSNGGGERYYRRDFDETKYQADTWHTIAIEWNTTTGLCKTWFDNKLRDKCPLVDERFDAADALEVAMGAGPASHFDIDAVEIYDMARIERDMPPVIFSYNPQYSAWYHFNQYKPGDTPSTTGLTLLAGAAGKVRHPRQDNAKTGMPADNWQYLRVTRAGKDEPAGIRVAFKQPYQWGLVRFRVRKPTTDSELKAQLCAGERRPRGLVFQADGLLRKWQDKPEGATLLGAAPQNYKWWAGPWEYLFYDRALIPQKPEATEPSEYFVDLGHVYMRSDWGAKGIQVRFRCGPEVGKDDSDQNAFNIYAYGDSLTAAPPLPSTKGPSSQNSYDAIHWYWGTQARNTLMIGGTPQIGLEKSQKGRNYEAEWLGGEKYPPNGKIQDIILSPACDYVAGEAHEAYALVDVETFLRQLLFAKPVDGAPAYVVVYDQLAMKDGKPTRFDWQLHSPFPFAVEGKSVTVTGGNKAWLRASLLLPDKAVLHMEKTPGETDQDRKDFLQVRPPLETGTTEYLALLEIGKKGQSAVLTTEKIDDAKQVGLKITGGPGEDLVLFSRAGRNGELTSGPWSAKARALCVRQTANGPSFISLHGGTQITGPLAMTCDQPVNAVLERLDAGKLRLTVWNDQPVTVKLTGSAEPLKLDKPGRHTLTLPQ